MISSRDREYLDQAIIVSRRALEDEGKTPFGAIVIVDDRVISEGTSSVIERCDPTAHAEVMALRNAAQRLARHLMPDAVMYSSSEPCPMCLSACYWARIPRIVFGATSFDVAANGFEDLQIYREFTLPQRQRSMDEVAAAPDQRQEAAAVLAQWAAGLPEPVVPKL